MIEQLKKVYANNAASIIRELRKKVRSGTKTGVAITEVAEMFECSESKVKNLVYVPTYAYSKEANAIVDAEEAAAEKANPQQTHVA